MVWGDSGKLPQLEVNKITSVFNPVTPLTSLWPNGSSKHKDLKNEEDFSSDEERKEEIKSCKQGNKEAMTVSFVFISGLLLLGIRITNPLCQLLQIRGHYPLLPQRGGNHAGLKHLSQYGSKLSLRKLTN